MQLTYGSLPAGLHVPPFKQNDWQLPGCGCGWYGVCGCGWYGDCVVITRSCWRWSHLFYFGKKFK